MTSSRAVDVARDPEDPNWIHFVAKLLTIENQNPHQLGAMPTAEMTAGTRHALGGRNQIRLRTGLRSGDLNSDYFRQPMSGHVQQVEKRTSMTDYIRNRWLLKGLLLKYNKDSLLDGGSIADTEQPIEDEGELKQDASQEGTWRRRLAHEIWTQCIDMHFLRSKLRCAIITVFLFGSKHLMTAVF
jgi:hypothetical protein